MGVHLACGRVRVRLTEGAFLAGGGCGQEFRRLQQGLPYLTSTPLRAHLENPISRLPLVLWFLTCTHTHTHIHPQSLVFLSILCATCTQVLPRASVPVADTLVRRGPATQRSG